MKKPFLSIFSLALCALAANAAVEYHKGDINSDLQINVSDVTSLVNQLLCPDDGSGHLFVSDINDDGLVNVADVSMLVNHVVNGLEIDQRAGYDFVWDYNALPEFHITVPLSEWNRLLDLYDANPKTKQYVTAHCAFRNGNTRVEIGDIGLRLRGNTSRVRPEGYYGSHHSAGDTDWHHFHMGLKFDKFFDDDEHTLRGIKKVKLKWFKEDPAYVRELYCYELFRRSSVWTASDDNYCRVWIQVEGDEEETYYGIYNLLEPVDKPYLKRRKEDFGSNKGNLWKCEYGASLSSIYGDYWYDDDTDNDHTYTLQTNIDQFDEAKAQLHDFILKLTGKSYESFKAWLPTVCDVDLLLKTYAVNVAVGMWDDYWNNSNNYYLYFNTTDRYNYKFYFIPYDYDNTLGTSAACGAQNDAGRHDPLNWGTNGNPLIKRVLEIPEYREKYIAYLKNLAANQFHFEMSTRRIKAWHNKIQNFVANDTGEDMTISDQPASWGNHHEYRLLEDDPDNNFFRVKCATINAISATP